MPPMVTSTGRIVIVPVTIVDGHSHFWRIAIIQTVGAAIVLIAPIVLRVRNIRIVIKLVEVYCRR